MREESIRWYKDLYLSDGLDKKKANKYKKTLAKKYFLKDFYVIAISLTQTDQLEFFSARQLMQPHMPKMGYDIVGLATNYDEALSLIEHIVQDVYEKTGDVALKDYFSDKMKDSIE